MEQSRSRGTWIWKGRYEEVGAQGDEGEAGESAKTDFSGKLHKKTFSS